MNRQRIIYTDIAIVSKAMRAMGKPVTVEEIADHLTKLLCKTDCGLEEDIKMVLENYQPLGYFQRKGDLYSLPAELLAIMNELEREKKRQTVASQNVVAKPQEPDEVYARASHMDVSKSLTYPYLYRFS
ncbi:uncharacterized protein [Drosophila kikkawai]|uniref:DUF4777 domain-containing protein n=1 Tax=Drosophila kikkawai TaxID=30033 RepID=A0A6P4I4W2_DROKI|nr:uncharacterized protein LOC108075878 [Drosophila kikkawai]